MAKKLFKVFDNEIWKLWKTILGGTGTRSEQLVFCKEGDQRSQRWACLPTRFGGAGLRNWFNITDYSWYCSVAECAALQDPNFDRGRKYLKVECEEDYKLALTALGGNHYINQADFEFVPPEEPDVLYNSDYYKHWHVDYNWAKVQKEFSGFLARKELKQLTSSTELKKPHITESEHVRSRLAFKKQGESVLTQLFTANLSDHEARLTKAEFVISARQFLSLPALKIPRGELVELKCGCEDQKCATASCCGTIVDPAGNHALLSLGNGCQESDALRASLGTSFSQSRWQTRETTSNHAAPGRCRPGSALNQEETKKNTDLAVELVDAFLMAPNARRESVISEVRSRLPELKDDAKAVNNMLRFDLCMGAAFPADAPKELWLDHAIVHETSESYRTHVIEDLDGDGDPMKSYPFRRVQETKQRKYRALTATATHLLKQKLLDFQPFFLFPLISALGYLNEDAIKVDECGV